MQVDIDYATISAAGTPDSASTSQKRYSWRSPCGASSRDRVLLIVAYMPHTVSQSNICESYHRLVENRDIISSVFCYKVICKIEGAYLTLRQNWMEFW